MAAITQSKANEPRAARFHVEKALIERSFVALTLLGIVLGSVLERVEAPTQVILGVHIATYFVGGYYAVLAIIEALRERTIEVDLLMVLAASGAAYIGSWTEGAILLFLFSLSNALQNEAMARTRRAISALLDLRPDTVTVRNGEELLEIAPDDVTVGQIVVLRPGERVALDGVIVRGEANFDESSITGEALPIHKGPGLPVMAGTLNQSGSLDVRVTKLAGESTLARVIAMVSAAQERKARTQRFLDKFEQYYAMGVISAVALFILLVPPLFGIEFSKNFYTAMVLLTVASPCALVISVPSALLSAIANAARRGVLFKGGAHLEDLSRVKVVAFDKTGTLTFGKPELTDLIALPGFSEAELLDVLARAEAPSEHPVARAIQMAVQARGLTVAEPDAFEAIAGMGVRAVWDGEQTLVGSPRLMESYGLVVPTELTAALEQASAAGRRTALLVHRGGQWLGAATVMGRERPDAAERIADLRAAGIEKIVMLTGDNAQIAEPLAKRVGIDEVYAGLLPEDKLRIVEDLGKRYGAVAMVGDGINDAPALAAASTGIAMGAAGTDAALESADLVLMSDDLSAIAYAIRLSKRTQQIVWQNIVFALGVVVVLVTLTLTIGVPLPLGVVGHEGSTIIVVLNGLRLLGYHE
ncbi:MAG: heavy metal translocating P-type ATPase [Roseiflexaceae bacterium]|nr:heavy metal translocating P-type ATPase [Roseiflexaceae bacterium]